MVALGFVCGLSFYWRSVVRVNRQIPRLILSEGKTPEMHPGQRGFSLVELLTAVAIIAILAAIALPAYSDYAYRARIARCKAEIMTLQASIAAYKVSNDRQPDTLAHVGYGDLLDPWGHPYQYLNIADSSIKGKGSFRKDRFLNPLNSDYDLYSMGADGQSRTPLSAPVSHDDVIRASNGGFIGLASDF